MKKTIIIALNLVCVAVLAAPSAPPTPSPSPAATGSGTTSGDTLTLIDAISRGLDYAPDLKKADSSVKQSVDQLDQERGALFPAITGTAAAENKQNASNFNGGAIPSYSSSNGNFYQLALNLTQPLYAGGALTSGLAYYKDLEDQARQTYFNTKEMDVFNIVTAFYGLAQAQETLNVSTQNRDILKSYLDITTYYERIGRARQIDKMQAQVNYSLALVTVESSSNAETNAISNLDKVLGESNDKKFKADFHVAINDIGGLTLEQAFDAVLKNNPTILTDQLKVEQVDYQADVDLAQDKPSLNLVGQAGLQADDLSDLTNNAGSQFYSIGLSLNVPIFSGLSSIYKRQSYNEQSYQAKRQLQIDEDTLRNQVENSMLTIRSVRNQLEVTQKSVKEARVALDLANKAYRQGTAASIDVLNLQTTLYNAEQLFVTTEYSYLNTLLGLRQQMGIDLEKAYVH